MTIKEDKTLVGKFSAVVVAREDMREAYNQAQKMKSTLVAVRDVLDAAGEYSTGMSHDFIEANKALQSVAQFLSAFEDEMNRRKSNYGFELQEKT